MDRTAGGATTSRVIVDPHVLVEALAEAEGAVRQLGPSGRQRPIPGVPADALGRLLRRSVAVECVHLAFPTGVVGLSCPVRPPIAVHAEGFRWIAPGAPAPGMPRSVDLLLTRAHVWRAHWADDGSYLGASEMTGPVDVATAQAQFEEIWARARPLLQSAAGHDHRDAATGRRPPQYPTTN